MDMERFIAAIEQHTQALNRFTVPPAMPVKDEPTPAPQMQSELAPVEPPPVKAVGLDDIREVLTSIAKLDLPAAQKVIADATGHAKLSDVPADRIDELYDFAQDVLQDLKDKALPL